jgi:Na+/phosphate symporter
MVLAGNLKKEGGAFSGALWAELRTMQENIVANIKLASNEPISDDIESVCMLNMDKAEIKRIELGSCKRHFKRLKSGDVKAFVSSYIHLEPRREFRDGYNNIAAVAALILHANGQLWETRLIEHM